MSYAAEPYAQFVDDLLRALTGGVVRQRFRFIDEELPFRLSPPGPIVPSTLLVYGQAGGEFRRFERDRDYAVTPDTIVEWRAREDGSQAADAIWPDEGTDFFVNYDHTGPGGAIPNLSDRNPGSVTRLLAESFAREYAVMSKQLESIYRAGFLGTSEGRDLDQLVALLGLERQTRANAVGSVIFARTSPALADLFVPSGTKVSTAEPPIVTFETIEEGVLRRGNLSVEVPIRAQVGGPEGVVPARAIRVLHRALEGISSVENSLATQLGSADETDESLRGRARRALEGAGRATNSAIIAALTTIPGVRENYVRIEEDHLLRPGMISLSLAADLTVDQYARAVELIEETRPAGVRVLHNLHTRLGLGALEPSLDPMDEDPEATDAEDLGGEGLFFPIVIEAILLPASGSLSQPDRAVMKRRGEEAIAAFIADVGVGETLIYNRLVASLMTIDGVLDANVKMYPQGMQDETDTTKIKVRSNIAPLKDGRAAPLRPSLDVAIGGSSTVEVGGELVALDLTLSITMTEVGLIGDEASNRELARIEIAQAIIEGVDELDEITQESLADRVGPSLSYLLDEVSFKAEYIQAGVRMRTENTPIQLSQLDRPWVRSVALAEEDE